MGPPEEDHHATCLRAPLRSRHRSRIRRAPVAADGPETGLLSGTVANNEGEGLPGVQVSLEGGRGAQVTVTNDAGQYRFNLIVPGSTP